MPDFERFDNILEPFLESVRDRPERLAVVCDPYKQTYEEMGDLVGKIARAFRDRGVESGDKVAYLMPNSIELVAVYLDIQKIGAVADP